MNEERAGLDAAGEFTVSGMRAVELLRDLCSPEWHDCTCDVHEAARYWLAGYDRAVSSDWLKPPRPGTPPAPPSGFTSGRHGMSPEELAEIERAEAMRERAGLDARERQTAYDRGYMAGFLAAQRVTAEAVQALESPFDDARLSAAYYSAIADVAGLLEDTSTPSKAEPACCDDKGGAWCRDTTGLDHCVDGPRP